ncbi:hypothetical protein GpartN1_g3243.t1 [Galdieria partita]|uniref:Uncharacterized protein n=1 Tax=Galdieria partita TaxID=83374 RepID=A0A9C7UQD9_9RHOD|nr:hypothetical protein GpartN1_g3243.t1 [Galdieria partita]
MREETSVFLQIVDSLGFCLLNSDVTIMAEKDFPETDLLFENICMCLNNILCKIHHILGKEQTENCIDLLLTHIEPKEYDQNNLVGNGCYLGGYKIIFLMLFFMKKDQQKDVDIYNIIALNILRNNKAVSFIVNLICHSEVPNIRLVAASLIMQCLQIVCYQDSTNPGFASYNTNTRRFVNFSAETLPQDFEKILEIEPDLRSPNLQEYLVGVVSCLIRCGYPNFQAIIDKVILFLQLRCLFPDIRVRFLVVDTLECMLERIDWAGITHYVFITGMHEYLLESIKTAFQMKLETDADLECVASCFEGIFSIIEKLLRLEETRSSFVFQSIVQGMMLYLKFIKGKKQFENHQQTNQLLLSFFRLSHTFFEENVFASETNSTNSIYAQGFISLKFLIPFLDFLHKNEVLEEEMGYLLVEMTKDRSSSLEEQLELLIQMNTKFKSTACVFNVAYTVLCNVIRTTEEERPTDYIEIFHRILTPHITEYNVENLESKRQIDSLLIYFRIVNDFLIPTFWKGQTNEKLITVSKRIWRNFHPARLFSFFQICVQSESKIHLSNNFRAFIARLLTVLESDVKLDDVATLLPLSDIDICNSLQQISDASFVSLKLILLDHSIRGEWPLDFRKLCYCIEIISDKLPEEESLKHIQLTELVAKVWVILCREKAHTDSQAMPRTLRYPRQLNISKTFISFLFKHLPKEISKNVESIKLLIENSQIDMEACQMLQMRLVSLQNERFEDKQDSVLETTNYFKVFIELTASFDWYGRLFLHDISRFTQWLRFPLDSTDLRAFKETIHFWCDGLLHFTDDNDIQRIVLRLMKMGLFSKVNDFFHAVVDYYKKGYKEKDQSHLSSQINKIFVNLFHSFHKWTDLEAICVEYLNDVNSLLQSLLTAVDSFAMLPHEVLCEFLNGLHIFINFFDRIADSGSIRVTSSTSKSLVRNIISKKPWFHSSIQEYFELVLSHRCQEDLPSWGNCCSHQPHWESLLSLSTTLIAFGSKKNLVLLEMFPKNLLCWSNVIFGCYRFLQYQRPLLIVHTNLLFAIVARARAYQWEPASQQMESDSIFYILCNQIFSSHCLVEISAYRAMEAWILSLRGVQQPIGRQTTLEAVKSCLRIKLIQNYDTPLLVLAPRLSLFVRFLEWVEHGWVSTSHWESILKLVCQLMKNLAISNRIQWECIQHAGKSLEYAPRDCLEKYPDIMQAVHNLRNLNTCTMVSCAIIFNEIVLTPVIYQWQQDCHIKHMQSILEHDNNKRTTSEEHKR